eukprot:TRINITY_DN66655_c0_g1_i1.p1 TRINITY_DN66655_c0_g1~~TRINITY_DN66655_c0_g1_i1.p1  ORF type:complete len:259 (-),score=51.00 TRINITY_DN66655_c0_g1_i1:154-930(-)
MAFPGETTEWEDIQVKFGNFAPRPKETPQCVTDRAVVEAVEQWDPLEHAPLKELDELEDDVDEDVLARYRRKRMEELREAQKAARFGDVRQVGRTTFVKEVTEGSANGQWVVVLLYVDANPQCHPIMRPWDEAASRFPAVKFMRGVAAEVIPDYPDYSTPAVLLYKDTECQKQLIGIAEWGGGRCNADVIEWVLAQHKVVETDLEEDPREATSRSVTIDRGRRRGDQGSDEEDEFEQRGGDRCFTSRRLDQGLFPRHG